MGRDVRYCGGNVGGITAGDNLALSKVSENTNMESQSD